MKRTFWASAQQKNFLNLVLEMAELEESLETVYSIFFFVLDNCFIQKAKQMVIGLGVNLLSVWS